MGPVAAIVPISVFRTSSRPVIVANTESLDEGLGELNHITLLVGVALGVRPRTVTLLCLVS